MRRLRVGRAILAERARRGMTQADLARRSRVSQSHMARIEKGERLPSLELFLRIVQVLEADPTALLREAAAGLRGASRGLSRARAGAGAETEA